MFELFVGGYIITSLVFKDLNSPVRGYQYLILPASTFEKFLSKLLLTTIGWVISVTVLYFLFSLFANSINALIFNRSYNPFNPFAVNMLKGIGIYCLTQSVFFIGAIYFKKNAFLKTILSVFIIMVIIGTSIGLIIKYYMLDYIKVYESEFKNFMEIKYYNSYSTIIEIILLYVLAPILWIISFIKLKETEL